jgi:hypothetical protein
VADADGMSNFISLNSAQPKAVSRYKREVRAIVVDRAADYIEQLLPAGRKPSNRGYEKAFQEGLRRAKLDVMAELFRIMHDLARPSAVADWSRGGTGLRRETPSASATMKLIIAYQQVVRYVLSIRAQVRQP